MTSSYIPPRPGLAPAADAQRDEGWNLLESIIARWRLVVALPVAGALLVGASTFLVRSKFTTVTSFVAAAREQQSMLGGFASVASQLGVGLAMSPSNSPQFYADVLRSRGVLEEVLRARIPSVGAGPSDSSQILDLYEDHGRAEPDRLDRGISALTRESSVSVNPRTSIVELRVTAPSPDGSALVAKQFLRVLNSFNLEKRQSQAGARRRFLAARLREVQDSLGAAEQRLQTFLEANRQFRASPALQARDDAMQRQAQTYQELYTNLRRDYESARVDEVNDTPVITVIDTPAVPLRRSSPRRVVSATVGGMLGGFVALVLIFVGATIDRLRSTKPHDYDRLIGLLRAFRNGRATRAP